MEDFRQVGKLVSNWGRWGDDDRIGTLNYITPEKMISAARLVKRGKLFELAIPVDVNGPMVGIMGRNNPVHHMTLVPADFKCHAHGMVDGIICTDDFLSLPLQSGTQWDGLAHVGYDNLFYNNVADHSVMTAGGSSVLGIDQIAEKGIFTRGVLLDIARLRGIERLEAGDVITPDELEAAEKAQNVEVQPGDALIVRTGWIQRFTKDHDNRAFWNGEPGIDISAATWLHERRVAALAFDNGAVEVLYPNATTFPLPVHAILIRDMGMTLGEIFDLDKLAEDCVSDGVWEFLFVAPPLKVTGGVGTPITPIALK